MLIRYLTHPQVRIDANVPVPQWGLSEVGRGRVEALVAAGWLKGTVQIVSSAERKAVETAEPIAAALGVRIEIREAMHENDRSATGFLPPPEFEAVADAFFADPETSIRGWERAVDAQARIVGEAEAVFRRGVAGDILLVGHGGVGTLLFCHYAGIPISRDHDQLAGGGCFFTMEAASKLVLHGWLAMENALEATTAVA